MAYNFPDSPSNGDTVTINGIVYTYNSTKGAWKTTAASGGAGGGASVTVSETAPTSPSEGDLWFDPSVLKTFVYYNDGTANQWVQSNPTGSGGGASGGASVTVSETAPTSPSAGDLWWSSSEAVMYIYYTDTDSSQWVSTSVPGADGADGADGAAGADGVDGTSDITKSASDPTITTNGSVGDLWINTTTGEMYVLTDATTNDNVWTNIGDGTGNIEAVMALSGGTETTITENNVNYKVHTFTSSGTLTVTGASGQVEYLVVAGGGGAWSDAGGSGGGAGGGAGGYRCSVVGESSGGGASAESKLTLSPQSYTITIGAGGVSTGSGSDSVFSSITAIGGGGGRRSGSSPGIDGGSGAGQGINSNNPTGGIGTGTAGQGYNGGAASTANSGTTGGGGGAAQAGSTGNGGNGVESSIDGTPTYRAGGGAGQSVNGTTFSGGSGGGGNSRTNGAANTGGGAGGQAPNSGGYNGGSGIVIIRYAI